jgi:Zn-dependent protease
MSQVDFVHFFITIAVILIGLALHEYAHAKMADIAGDPTPRLFGRVTLNPFNHLDPVGTIMIIVTSLTGFGIGWGRPVPMNPAKMRNPRWDHFAAVAAGPISNLVQAAVYAVILRVLFGVAAGNANGLSGLLGDLAGPVLQFVFLGVIINLALCFFNLIPLGPLDGHWMLGTFMSEPTRMKWYLWNRQAGGFVFLGLIFMGQLFPEMDLIGAYLRPVTLRVFRFLAGDQAFDLMVGS